MSEVIGICGGCLYSDGYKALWYDKNNILHCNAYPEGVPEKVMRRLEKTGYCPRRDKDFTEWK